MIEFIVWAMAAVLLHETGHAVATKLLGLEFRGLVLDRRGFGIKRQRGASWENFVVSVAGPLVNLLLFFVVDDYGKIANGIMLLVNVLPLRGSDGYSLILCLKGVR